MVRHYKQKGKNLQWNEEDMEQAIQHARRHSNVKATAVQFGIPVSTLRDHLSGKVPAKGAKVGHPTALSEAQEREIVETCLLFAEWGFGLGRREVESILETFLKATKQKNPFRGDSPGEGWWSGFMRRHPELSQRKPQQLQMVRAKASCEEVITHWFGVCLGPVLEKLQLVGKPECIFNVDESGFPLSWTPRSVLTKRGQKSPQALVAGSGRENITVQACASASGQLLPPYIVYKGERLIADTTFGGPLGTRFSVSHNGWMTGEGFLDWLRSLFLPSLPAERPILLLLDGHSSHIGYEVRRLAAQNGVHLLKLPPHTTHLLQPLDVGVFNCMKDVWQRVVGSFTRRERRPIAKRDFPALLGEAWRKFKPEWAVGGFKKAGVVPFNPQAISTSSFLPSQVFADPETPPLAALLQARDPSEMDEACLPSGPSAEPIGIGSPLHSSSPPSTSHPSSIYPATLMPPPSVSPLSSVPSITPTLPPVNPSSYIHPVTPTLPSSATPLSSMHPVTPIPTTSTNPITPTLPHSVTPLSSVHPITPQSSSLHEASLHPLNPASSSSSLIPGPALELKGFFAELLKKTNSVHRPAAGGRRRLIGHGESLTADDAIERVRVAEEEKRRKEEQKNKRAEERKRKQNEKQTSSKKPKRSSTVSRDAPIVCPVCLIPEDSDGELWVECESCQQWYHASCAHLDGYTQRELKHHIFLCDVCTGEMHTLTTED